MSNKHSWNSISLLLRSAEILAFYNCSTSAFSVSAIPVSVYCCHGIVPALMFQGDLGMTSSCTVTTSRQVIARNCGTDPFLRWPMWVIICRSMLSMPLLSRFSNNTIFIFCVRAVKKVMRIRRPPFVDVPMANSLFSHMIVCFFTVVQCL